MLTDEERKQIYLVKKIKYLCYFGTICFSWQCISVFYNFLFKPNRFSVKPLIYVIPTHGVNYIFYFLFAALFVSLLFLIFHSFKFITLLPIKSFYLFLTPNQKVFMNQNNFAKKSVSIILKEERENNEKRKQIITEKAALLKISQPDKNVKIKIL